jgi:hypothetical protein
MDLSIEEPVGSVAKAVLRKESVLGPLGQQGARANLATLQHQAKQRAMLISGTDKLRKQLSGLAKYTEAINLPQIRLIVEANQLSEYPSLLSRAKIPDANIRAMQKMATMPDISSNIFADIKRFLAEPQYNFIKKIEEMNAFSSFNKLVSVMEALHSPSIRMSKHLNSMSHTSPNYLDEVLTALNGPVSKFYEQMSALQGLHKRADGAQYAFVNHQIEVEGIDSFAIGDIEIQPVTEEGIALSRFADSGDYKDCISVMNVFINQGQANPSFWLNPWMIAIFMALISAIINPIIEDAWKAFSNAVPPAATKNEVRELMSDALRIDCSNEHKLVIKNGISVRGSASANAKLITHLKCWDLVKVQEVRKDWSLISWTDSTDNIKIQGWVFSRYLSKPNQL